MKPEIRERIIEVARNRRPAELLLKNANVLNVFTGEIIKSNIAIECGFIAGVGNYTAGANIEDLEGRFLAPGFINAHCHVESSMVTPGNYCAEELRWGVTTLITDPHEVANVAGAEGIMFMLDATENLPINYYIQLPSCVPATMFEHAGATLDAGALKPLLQHARVLGLGEMMDYPGVLGCDSAIMSKLELAQGRVIDGHAPGLGGADLQAYIAAGIGTDHESVSFSEALEKIRSGMAVLVREGSASKNLEDIICGAVAVGLSTDLMAFCTDDKHIADVRSEGTISHCLRKSIELGLDAAEAYRMASYNAAKIYGLRGLGAIAPGWRADMVALDDLRKVTIDRVYKDGRKVTEERLESMAREAPYTVKGELRNKADKARSRVCSVTTPKGNSVHIAPVGIEHLVPKARADGLFPVIGIVEKQIVTTKEFVSAEEAASGLRSGGLCKAAVIERHNATGNIGVALLAGYGLRSGAIASTVSHDSHNLIIAGVNDRDMLAAAEEIRRMGGGFAYVREGVVEGAVPLPLFGLMSDGNVPDFIRTLEGIVKMAHTAGVPDGVDPLVTLSFLALPVIPALRVTDMGVFDVEEFKFIQ